MMMEDVVYLDFYIIEGRILLNKYLGEAKLMIKR